MHPPYRITYLTSGGREADGITKTVLNLATYLDSAAFEPRVVTLRPCRLLDDSLPAKGISIRHADPSNPFASLRSLLQGSDLIHIQDSPGNHLLYYAAATSCANVVESIQTTQIGKNFFRDMHTVCISKDILTLQPDGERTHLIYDSAEVPEALPTRPSNKRLQLIQIGRPEKFLFSLADILPRLDVEEIDGLIIGHERAGPPNLRCIPYTPDVDSHLRDADLLVHFPWEEGLGLVAIEALAWGVVPVVSGVGGLLEIVEDRTSGFLLGRDSFEDAVHTVSDAVDLAARRPTVFEDMRRSGHRRAGELFAAGEAARKHEKLYLDLLQEGRRIPEPLASDEFQRALDSLFTGGHQAAIHYLEKKRAARPDFHVSLFTALAAADWGPDHLARSAFSEAIEIDPRSLFAVNAYADWCRTHGEHELHIHLIDRSLAISPFQLDLYAEAAEEMAKAAQWDLAEQYLLRLENVIAWRFPFARRHFDGLKKDFERRRG